MEKMMQILNWVGEHPFLTFFLALVVAGTIRSVFNAILGRPQVIINNPKEDDSVDEDD